MPGVCFGTVASSTRLAPDLEIRARAEPGVVRPGGEGGTSQSADILVQITEHISTVK